MRRPPQLCQNPRPLQENGRRRSSPQPAHRNRAKPFASTPHVRNSRNSRSTNRGKPAPSRSPPLRCEASRRCSCTIRYDVSGNLADALPDRGSDTGGVRGNQLRSALVVLEVALSLVLLVGAGSMVRSFAQLQRVDPGFDARNVVTFNAPLQFPTYLTTTKRATFANELADRLRAIPGVERVGRDVVGTEAETRGYRHGRAGLYRRCPATTRTRQPGHLVHTDGVWYEARGRRGAGHA